MFDRLNQRAVSPYLPGEVQTNLKAAITDRICAAVAVGSSILVTIESEDGEQASNLATFYRCLGEYSFQYAEDATKFAAGDVTKLAIVYDADAYISVEIEIEGGNK